MILTLHELREKELREKELTVPKKNKYWPLDCTQLYGLWPNLMQDSLASNTRFGASQAPTRKMDPGGLQRVVLDHFRRQPAKWSQEASRGSFWSISSASPQSGPRRPPEVRFGRFQAPARQVAPGGLQRIVLEYFRRQPAKSSQEACRESF